MDLGELKGAYSDFRPPMNLFWYVEGLNDAGPRIEKGPVPGQRGCPGSLEAGV